MLSRIEKLFPNHTQTHTVNTCHPSQQFSLDLWAKSFDLTTSLNKAHRGRYIETKQTIEQSMLNVSPNCVPEVMARLKPGYAWSIPSVHFPHSEFTCTKPPPQEWLFLCKWRLSGAKKKGKSKQLAHIIIKQQILKSLPDSVSCFHRLNHSTDCWQTTEKKRTLPNEYYNTDTPPKRSPFHFIPTKTKKSTPQSASRDHHTPEIRALSALEALLSEI